MRDTNEEIVGRVLEGLRDAAPPDGMESRIVSAVRHRASTTPIPSRAPWRTTSLAGGAVLAGVLCALFFTAQRKVPQAPFPRSQTIAMHAVNGPATSPKTAMGKPPKRAARRAQLATAPPPKEDLVVISYPAPPMPLTEQEKLLLRLVHKDDPVQLAMLDPAKRSEQYAGQRADFKQFFDPPPTGESK